MDPLLDSEISDAKGIVAARGLNPSDFDFQARRRDQPTGTHLHLVRYIITVSREGRSVEYLGGHGLEWLGRFEADLARVWWTAQG